MKKRNSIQALSAILGLVLLFLTNTVSAEIKIQQNMCFSDKVQSAQLADSLNKYSVRYSAKDSITFNKQKSRVSLYGDAKISCADFTVSGDEITFDKSSGKVTAKNYVLTNIRSKDKKRGAYGEFSVPAKP